MKEDRAKYLHHKHAEISRKVDMVCTYMPLICLEMDTWDPSTSFKVGEKGGSGYSEQDQVFLPPRPVEWVLGIIRRLRDKHSL
jgi:hypothetical protein